MSFRIHIAPAAIEFTAGANETLLEAAQRQGVDLPFRCQQGICGACVCRLKSGQFVYAAAAHALLSQTPSSYVYCCQAYATSDIVLHHPFVRADRHE
jgi:CDP-4-dehydro-6-deoxyglucose reductase